MSIHYDSKGINNLGISFFNANEIDGHRLIHVPKRRYRLRMSRIIVVLLSLAVLMTFGSCTNNKGQSNKISPTPTQETVPATQKTTDRPTANAFGPFSIMQCEIDGPPIESKNLKAIAATANTLFVMEGGYTESNAPWGALRRYSITPGADCSLTMDTTFGNKGRLTDTNGFDNLSTNAKGALYVVSDQKLLRLAGDRLEEVCKGDVFSCASSGNCEGSMVFIDDNNLLVNNRGMGPQRHKWYQVELNSDSCKQGYIMGDQTLRTFKPELTWSNADIIGDQLIMVGRLNQKSRYQLFAFPFQGGAPATTFDTSNEICSDSGAIGCGDGVCVLDTNCKRLKIYNADGSFKNNIGFEEPVFGHLNPFAPEIDQATADSAFLVVHSKEEKPAAGNGHALFYRITGLETK